jgi:hypothetical protein
MVMIPGEIFAAAGDIVLNGLGQPQFREANHFSTNFVACGRRTELIAGALPARYHCVTKKVAS